MNKIRPRQGKAQRAYQKRLGNKPTGISQARIRERQLNLLSARGIRAPTNSGFIKGIDRDRFFVRVRSLERIRAANFPHRLPVLYGIEHETNIPISQWMYGRVPTPLRVRKPNTYPALSVQDGGNKAIPPGPKKRRPRITNIEDFERQKAIEQLGLSVKIFGKRRKI